MKQQNLIYAVRRALAEMLPIGVSAHVEFCSAEFPHVDRELGHLQGAASARFNEFVTGRHCLRIALGECGVNGPIQLPPDVDGLPVLPEGYVGSISHSRGLCLAVAAEGAQYIILGVDVEKTNRIGTAAIQRVVQTEEAAWVEGDQKTASLLFSAKEAFYKAQFARERINGNFEDLVLTRDSTHQTLRAVYLSEHFSEDIRGANAPLLFSYRYVDDYVVTLCCKPAK